MSCIQAVCSYVVSIVLALNYWFFTGDLRWSTRGSNLPILREQKQNVARELQQEASSQSSQLYWSTRTAMPAYLLQRMHRWTSKGIRKTRFEGHQLPHMQHRVQPSREWSGRAGTRPQPWVQVPGLGSHSKKQEPRENQMYGLSQRIQGDQVL